MKKKQIIRELEMDLLIANAELEKKTEWLDKLLHTNVPLWERLFMSKSLKMARQVEELIMEGSVTVPVSKSEGIENKKRAARWMTEPKTDMEAVSLLLKMPQDPDGETTYFRKYNNEGKLVHVTVCKKGEKTIEMKREDFLKPENTFMMTFDYKYLTGKAGRTKEERLTQMCEEMSTIEKIDFSYKTNTEVIAYYAEEKTYERWIYKKGCLGKPSLYIPKYDILAYQETIEQDYKQFKEGI